MTAPSDERITPIIMNGKLQRTIWCWLIDDKDQNVAAAFVLGETLQLVSACLRDRDYVSTVHGLQSAKALATTMGAPDEVTTKLDEITQRIAADHQREQP